jgi:polyisoprenoid-binding protein YceI
MNKLMTLTSACALSTLAMGADAADTYKVTIDHTFPSFEINHMGFSTFRGRFEKSDGSVTLNTAAKTVSADITIQADSISTGVEKLNTHLKSPDFFDVAQFPTLTFKSMSSRFKGDKPVSITGDLTMHGVTRPLTLKIDSFACKQHPLYKVPACGANASAVIKRTDWGIGKLPPAIVGDEVTLKIQIEVRQ